MLKYCKHLAAAFVACLVLVLLAQPAEAVGGQQGAFTYELKGNGTAVITKFDWYKHSGGDVYVPRSIDGYQVTTIGKMAFSNSSVESKIVHPQTYGGGLYLKNEVPRGTDVAIILPDTITVIEEKAFFWTGITACDIPASVQIIEPGAFAGCVNIRQFSVNSGNRTYAVIDGVLFHKARKELVAFPFNRDIGNSNRIDYTIPEGIQSIGEYAFYCIGHNSIDKTRSNHPLRISFPSSLKTIDDYAFYGAVFFGESASILQAEYIGNYAFAYSVLPYLSYWAEEHWDTEHFMAPQTIGDYAFYCSTASSSGHGVKIDCRNLESLGEGAFMNSWAIRTNHFEVSAVSVIASHAFDKSASLPLGLPNTVQEIKEYAFANNRNLSIQIPSRVKAIHSNAFAQSSGTISFADGSSLKSIGAFAFYEFETTSSKIVLPEGVETIGTEAFYTSTNKGVALLSVPASVTSIGDNVVNRTITVMQVEPGSYADIWASENGFPMQVDDTSWLFE